MIQKKTTGEFKEGIKDQIKDWSNNDKNTLNDLRVLVDRIRDTGVSRAMEHSLVTIKEVIDELLSDLEEP